jgi:hypothetical protein
MISIVTQEGLAASQEAARDESLNSLEAAMAAGFPAVECPVKHCFSPGVYTRTMRIPKGTLLTSKIHRTEHQFVLIEGEIAVWTKEAGWSRATAPAHGISLPGTRRVGYAISDTLWMTIHPTSKTTVEEVEEEIIEPHQVPLGPIPRFNMEELT